MTPSYRAAAPDDADAVLALVRRAYRGDEASRTWTSEAHLLADQRISRAGVLEKISAPDGVVLLAHDPDLAPDLLACCELVHRAGGIAYFGMFAVRPDLQAAGLGRAVLAAAEAYAVARWDVSTLEMTVIAQRAELIAWYERRGYRVTGERREFPYDALVDGPALRDDLYFEVLTKPLG